MEKLDALLTKGRRTAGDSSGNYSYYRGEIEEEDSGNASSVRVFVETSDSAPVTAERKKKGGLRLLRGYPRGVSLRLRNAFAMRGAFSSVGDRKS